MTELKTSTDWKHLVSTLKSDVMVSVTAPLEIHDRIMIGYAASPEESYCADMTVNEFVSTGRSLYVHMNAPRAFHGLKRIWEFMDRKGSRTAEDPDNYIDIHKIIDTKLMAFLLDPESAKEAFLGDKRIQEGLTLAHVAHRYLRKSMAEHLDFTDERVYDFLTAWIVGTYFYPIFKHYPYVHFTGPRATGKSQCLHFLECLCHNAKTSGSMSLAVQFRLIEALQPTILFDEMENLGKTQHTELHRMLKYGFEKHGGKVWRMEASETKQEINSWNVYCPRAFASIEGTEEVLASRSVQIIMERSYKDAIKTKTISMDDQQWQDLRDELFLVAMTEAANIKNTYDNLVKPEQISFSGRDWDIFQGILTVGTVVGDKGVMKRLVSFGVDTHKEKVDRDHDNSPDVIILRFLSEKVQKPGWYELGSLNDELTAMASSQGLDLQGAMTKDRLKWRIASLKVYEKGKKRRANKDGQKVTEYWLEPDNIRKILDNHLN